MDLELGVGWWISDRRRSTADVAGYSRLMGADEEGTHERFQAHLQELVNPKIADHRGRMVKNTGDGFLAEFASVVDAVRCAVEVQRGIVERNVDVPTEKRIELRVGINLGDVIAEGEDIFGDGVNVAARLEALAQPGGICLSRVVRDQVRDRLDYAFEASSDEITAFARPIHRATPSDLARATRIVGGSDLRFGHEADPVRHGRGAGRCRLRIFGWGIGPE